MDIKEHVDDGTQCKIKRPSRKFVMLNLTTFYFGVEYIQFVIWDCSYFNFGPFSCYAIWNHYGPEVMV